MNDDGQPLDGVNNDYGNEDFDENMGDGMGNQ